LYSFIISLRFFFSIQIEIKERKNSIRKSTLINSNQFLKFISFFFYFITWKNKYWWKKNDENFMRYYLNIVPTFPLDLYRYDQIQKPQVAIEVVIHSNINCISRMFNSFCFTYERNLFKDLKKMSLDKSPDLFLLELVSESNHRKEILRLSMIFVTRIFSLCYV
jgi:hypothetical protein